MLKWLVLYAYTSVLSEQLTRLYVSAATRLISGVGIVPVPGHIHYPTLNGVDTNLLEMRNLADDFGFMRRRKIDEMRVFALCICMNSAFGPWYLPFCSMRQAEFLINDDNFRI